MKPQNFNAECVGLIVAVVRRGRTLEAPSQERNVPAYNSPTLCGCASKVCGRPLLPLPELWHTAGSPRGAGYGPSL